MKRIRHRNKHHFQKKRRIVAKKGPKLYHVPYPADIPHVQPVSAGPVSNYLSAARATLPSSGSVQQNAGVYHSEIADNNTGGAGYPYDLVTVTNGSSPSGDAPPYSVWSGTYKYVYTGYGSHGFADVSGSYTDYYSIAVGLQQAKQAENDALAAQQNSTIDAQNAATRANIDAQNAEIDRINAENGW